jgi:hypothetical protein
MRHSLQQAAVICGINVAEANLPSAEDLKCFDPDVADRAAQKIQAAMFSIAIASRILCDATQRTDIGPDNEAELQDLHDERRFDQAMEEGAESARYYTPGF